MFARIEIDETRCKGCGLCTVACPRMLLKLGEETHENGYVHAVITAEDQEKCVGCAMCAGMCPAIAIDVYSIRHLLQDAVTTHKMIFAVRAYQPDEMPSGRFFTLD